MSRPERAQNSLLITTRDRTVLQSGAEHCVDVLPLGQALTLLAHWVGDAATALPAVAAAVAEACGRLPLALATIGAMVRADEIDWGDARALLAQADLAELAARFPNYPYPSILAAIEVSVNALAPEVRARYLDLAIFPEDTPIPEPALAALWRQHNLCGARLRRCLGQLAARSLVTRDDHDRIRLHDLQRMYLQQCTDNLPQRHGQLADAYGESCPHGWGDSHDDGYLFTHLPWHLAEAERHEQLAALLFDGQWLASKLRATGITRLVADFELLPPAHDAHRDAHLVRDALRLSSHVLAHDAAQLPSQLVGRLGPCVAKRAAPIAGLIEQLRSAQQQTWLEPLVPSLTPPGGPLLRTLVGHTGSVTAVAITPNGQCAVSTSYDNTLKVWDLTSSNPPRTLAGNSYWDTAVAVTPNGTHALSASCTGTLTLWDIVSATEVYTSPGHSDLINAVAVTPDGAHVISASNDKTLKLWDVASGAVLRTLAGHAHWVTDVAVTPDGQRAVSASYDNTLMLWDLASGTVLRTMAGHTRGVTAVAVTRDGKHALSAARDNTLKLWDLASGTVLRTLAGPASGVTDVALTRDGKRALSGATNGTLQVWDLASGTVLCTLARHSDGIIAMAVTADGKYALSASDDNTIRLWDIASNTALYAPDGHSEWVTAVTVTPNGKCALSASDDNTLKLWDLESGTALHTLAGHTKWVTAVAVTPEGRYALSGSHDNTLKLWDLTSGTELRTLVGHVGGCFAVAVTPDGKRALSASYDNTLKLWDLESGTEIGTLTRYSRWVTAVAITWDGKRALLATDNNALALRDLVANVELCTPDGHTTPITAIALTRDGKRALSGTWDGTLKVWDLEVGTELRTMTAHAREIIAVSVTPDGKRALSASADKTLKLWDLDSGRCLATFTGEGSMTACALGVIGNRLIAGEDSGRIHFLRLVEPRDRAPATSATSCTDNKPVPDPTAAPICAETAPESESPRSPPDHHGHEPKCAGTATSQRAEPSAPHRSPASPSNGASPGLSSPPYAPARPLAPTLAQSDRNQLVQRLEACQGLCDPQQRNALVAQLPPGMRVHIEYAPTMRIHLGNIVDTCASCPDGLAALATAVRWVEGDTFAVQALAAFLADLDVAH